MRQHLIDPEICIRCGTCESRCPTGAISHGDNYVVDPAVCTFCMRCVKPCPTGAIDNWFNVERPYSLAEQHGWTLLPARPAEVAGAVPDAFDDEATRILAIAHEGLRGPAKPPASASKPRINAFTRASPARATVVGNSRITTEGAESDVHHIILDFGTEHFPYLEGQSVGLRPPGLDAAGRPHEMRLYSAASARDGERPNTNNLALTVKRVVNDGVPGIASNWLCDRPLGEELDVVGPFGATFLMPDDPQADLLMICTGTGVSPFRGFTHRRRRTAPHGPGGLYLFFGARRPEELPYFGPLQRYVQSELHRELVYSRVVRDEHEYVQDRLLKRADIIADLLRRPTTHLYVCGLKGLEAGVDTALGSVCAGAGLGWETIRTALRDEGRLHVETY
ncbi:benzoyl-CoA 2,3-dioxygenase component A [Amaricoccus macauensis]|uniref:Benzoyl-CoA 2,3-dioxygenase component A n=1 Tax=Amaricoccus macauensis TaxID=57001 RepID=A0A840SKW3_9RHOB|nr:benzoyl-CoA 2,3-epoxidase subunit BoxA [Amaricoccus macauensis]MBB5220526.1 benzoyl-CoA 2,3-dioxygenase component A [Amaricoccus macauensis]